LGFQGKGYSLPFIENFKKIADYLGSPEGENHVIHITRFSDSICEPCPNRSGATCSTEEKIQNLDFAHQKALKLDDIHEITWLDAKERIKNHLTIEKFHEICKPCEWKALGVCEKALIELKTNAKSGS
jgi:hypothetical protein